MRSVETGLPAQATAGPGTGTKRTREDDSEVEVSSQPVLKQARMEAVAPPSPEQQALFDAVGKGDVERVRHLLTQFPALSNTQYPGLAGETLLCRAAGKGDIAMVSLLIEKGAAVNACARSGASPLMFAARGGRTDVIRELVQKGADPNVVIYLKDSNGQVTPFSALCLAVREKQLAACKCLIELGVNFQQVMRERDPNAAPIYSPIARAIGSDYTELIGWLLDTGRLTLESVEPASQMTLVNAAARWGSVSTVCYLAARGANMRSSWTMPDGQQLVGVWMVAAFYGKGNVIERLLRDGFVFPRLSQDEFQAGASQFVRNAWELVNHRNIRLGKHNFGTDGMTLVNRVIQPHQLLEQNSSTLIFGIGRQADQSYGMWKFYGLIGEFIQVFLFNADHIGAVAYRLCGKPFDATTSAQQGISWQKQDLQIVLEMVSEACGNPTLPTLFSGMGLSLGGEQAMNRMVVQQRDLLLQAVAHLRVRFEQQVASLPDLCISRFISPEHHLNAADLHRTLTEEWGLYDPIARAALRLVQEASGRLQCLKPEEQTALLAAQPPAERLKAMIVGVLDEWDKIPEIVAAIGEASSADEMDVAADLLFQQWRLFCEALGVTKERYLSIGPRRREEVGIEPMTVDDPS